MRGGFQGVQLGIESSLVVLKPQKSRIPQFLRSFFFEHRSQCYVVLLVH